MLMDHLKHTVATARDMIKSALCLLDTPFFAVVDFLSFTTENSFVG